MSVGSIIDPNFWIPAYGAAFLFTAVTGLVIGTFEFAFNKVSDTLLARMAIHVIGIPIGAYLLKVQTPANIFEGGVKDITREMFALAGVSVGSFGLIIGSVELAFIPVNTYLIRRLGVYLIILWLGLFIK